MKFLIDNMLPLQLAIWLRSRGHDATHVVDRKMDHLTDLGLWNRAADEMSVVISKDEDLVFLANRPGDRGRLIWVRKGNCRNAALLARSIDEIICALAEGQRIVELR